MSRDGAVPRSTTDPARTGRALAALGDPVCRRIVSHLDEPKTGPALDEALDVPTSTLYRKLELLTESGLVETRIVIHADCSHSTQYRTAFDELSITLDDVLRIAVADDDRD